MKFQIFKDKAGHPRVRLIASNGRILMSSEAYSSKAKARKMIRSVRRNMLTVSIEDLT